MAIKVTFQDYYSVEGPSKAKLKEFKDYYASGGTKSLIIDMEATHAGVPLNNPRFYIPSRMKAGTSTIEVGDSPMKILKHHDADSDPIGKALYREYVDTIPEDLVGNPDVLVLTNNKSSMAQNLRAMRNLKRAGVLDREGYKGLGYIRLQAEVSDEKSVKQLEDGLFDAISTNFDSPNEIYCSVCGTNVVKDGWCEHDMGESYFADGMEEDTDMKFTCQYIPGEHFYKEASLINFKGDQHASIKIVDTKNKDKNQVVYMSKDSVESGHSTFQFKDSVEEDDMLKINGKEVILFDAVQKVFDQIKKLNAEMKDEEAYALTQKVYKLMASEKFVADAKEAEINEETSLQFAIDEVQTKDEQINSDKVAEEMRTELAVMKDAGEITEEEFKAADAKLSSEGIKKLPDSAFCGPDRSFPVPDCAHATAAQRLIGKYEGPGSKADILASVTKKAKALGCEDSKKEDDTSTGDNGDVSIVPFDSESVTKLNNDDLQKLFHTIELELIDRKQSLKRECSECAVHTSETEAAKVELGEARDTLAKSDNIVQILRSELRRSAVDYEAQVDAYVELGAELHSVKVEKVAVVSVLTQKYDTLDKAIEELKDSDIESEGKSIMDSFDIKEAALKINDGITNIPKGTVEDPTVNPDGDNKQLPEGLSASALEAIDNIKDCLKRGETSTAKYIYATMDKLKMFGDDLTFESLSADKINPAE